MLKNREILEKFCAKVRSDAMFRRLFQLAVCCSREQMHDQLMHIMGWTQDQNQETGASGGLQQKSKPAPPASMLNIYFILDTGTM